MELSIKIKGIPIALQRSDRLELDIQANDLVDEQLTKGIASYDFTVVPNNTLLSLIANNVRIDEVELLIDGLLVDIGYIEVNKITYNKQLATECDCTYYSQSYRWLDRIRNNRLRDLPIAPFIITLDNVKNANNLPNSLWSYPIYTGRDTSEYQFGVGLDGLFDLNDNLSRPCLKLLQIMRVIYNSLGYTVTGNVFNDEYLSNISIVNNGNFRFFAELLYRTSNLSVDSVPTFGLGLSLNDNSDEIVRLDIDYNLSPFVENPDNIYTDADMQAFYNASHSTIPIRMDYNFTIRVESGVNNFASITYNPTEYYFEVIDENNKQVEIFDTDGNSLGLNIPFNFISSNTLGASTIERIYNDDFSILLPSKHKIRIYGRIKTNAVGFIERFMFMELFYIMLEPIIHEASFTLPDITIGRFVEQFTDTFKVIERFDNINKIVRLDSLTELYRDMDRYDDKSMDIDDAFSYENISRELYEDLAVNNKYKFSNQDDFSTFTIPKGLRIDDFEFTSDYNTYGNQVITYKFIPFPLQQPKVDAVFIPDDGISLVVLKRENDSIDYGISFWNPQTTSIEFETVSLDTFQYAQGVNMQDILDIYYKDIQRVFNEGGEKWSVNLRYNLTEIINFPTFRIVYLKADYFNGYYYILKIEGFDGRKGSYRTELLKL